VGIGVFTLTTGVLSAFLAFTGNSSNLYSAADSQAESADLSSSVSSSQMIAQGVTGCAATLTANNPYSQINYRSDPSLSGRRLGYGLVGDRLTILDSSAAPDGYTWYKIRFQVAPNAEGWIRGDFVRGESSCTISRAPEQERLLLDDNAGTGANRLFDSSQISYFLDVAMGSEYGNSSAIVRRWEEDVCIQLNFPSQENISRDAERAVRSTVNQVIDDINDTFEDLADKIDDLDDSLSDRFDDWEPIELAIAGDGCRTPNLEFYYVRAENFNQYDPNARGGQVGHVWTWWNRNEINRARILISSNYLTDNERDHVIREELTQSLGILKDSWSYPNSIFYQGWTSVTAFDPMDVAVIKMLYHPALNPGMVSRDAEVELSRL